MSVVVGPRKLFSVWSPMQRRPREFFLISWRNLIASSAIRRHILSLETQKRGNEVLRSVRNFHHFEAFTYLRDCASNKKPPPHLDASGHVKRARFVNRWISFMSGARQSPPVGHNRASWTYSALTLYNFQHLTQGGTGVVLQRFNWNKSMPRLALSARVGLVYMEPILIPRPMKERQENRIKKEFLWILSVNFGDVRIQQHSIQLLRGTVSASENWDSTDRANCVPLKFPTSSAGLNKWAG